MTYTVYLAGPMSKIPEFNFPKFFDATAYLRQIHGWEVLSPAEKDLESIPWAEMVKVPGFATGNLSLYVEYSSFTMANAMEWDLPAIQKSDGIVLLDGWETSTGARWERTVAEALDRDIWLLHTEPGATGLPEWELVRDDDPKQLTNFMKGFGATELTREGTSRPYYKTVPPLSTAWYERTKADLTAAIEHERFYRILHSITDDQKVPEYTNPTEGDFDTLAKDLYPMPTGGEVRVVDPNTGGEKGQKLARFDLIPADALWKLAEHFGRGARKYADRNWEKGFNWSLSYAALLRHLELFWMGIDVDTDPALYTVDGVLDEAERVMNPVYHITAVAWQSMVLLSFFLRDAGTDDRPPATDNLKMVPPLKIEV